MSDRFHRLKTALADRYRVEKELGRGGMATVYLAQDLKHERRVAIKVLKPELAAVLGPDRFLREIKVTAQLNHPHVLPLLDSGEADGFLYYVMPFAQGESLRDRLNRERQLPVEDALQIAREVADALDYAHRHDLVHRDIKPENILLEEQHAVVADFGIARAISVAGGERLTATGVTVGTPEYMSPEQASGRGELDGRSDVYALGCVLYEMLAGQPPFTGPTAEAVVRQHLTAAVPTVAAIRAGVPASVTGSITRALSKASADRFTSAARFGDAIAGGVLAPPGRSRHRGRQLVLLGVGAVVLIGALVLGARVTREPPASAQPPYERTAIAVLPFQNLSAEGPHAYFAGGLHDEILTQLSKVAGLSLRGRTSVMGYAATTKPIRQIADELKVGTLVEATVQVVEDRLRVNVQLIDAAADEHVWAERYDRTLDDAFAIQSDVAQQIAAAVGAALSSTDQRRMAVAPTANTEAYRLFLQARDYRARPGYLRSDLETAQRLFERAVELDSEYAVARAALSEVHGWIHVVRYDPSPARAALQRQEAEAALRIAPDLPQAHVAVGLADYWGRHDHRRALGQFRTALKGLPNDPQLWAYVGYVERRMGRWNEAVEAFRKTRELDPLDENVLAELGITYRLLHRYSEAVGWYDEALRIAPDHHVAAVDRGRTFVLWQGQTDTLRAALSGLRPGAELGELGTTTAQHAQLLLWERQTDSLLQLVITARTRLFEGQVSFLPTMLYAGWAHQSRGEDPAAHAAFDSARTLLDSMIRELPSDWRVHAARGLAFAGLGSHDEALQEAQWLQRSALYREDALDGPLLAEDRARILAQSGEAEAALDEIERLLAGPSFLSAHTLRLDPRWDPIRDHPRFKAVLSRYQN